MNKPSSPKRATATQGGRANWYNYYAGYAPDFVADVIRQLSLGADDILLDPWNGAGTTTQVADEFAIKCNGYDINPAMVVIAKARLLSPTQVHPSEEALCAAMTRDLRSSAAEIAEDPLSVWFRPATASTLRSLEQRIREMLVPQALTPLLTDPTTSNFDRLSSLAAFFYVALFRVVRNQLACFQTSNPTWIKVPATHDDRIQTSRKHLVSAFATEVRAMSKSNDSHASCATILADSRTRIRVANSTSLPESDHSIAAVVSSPPYCTRIDYAIATRPELAVLGANAGALKNLRDVMIGSATIGGDIPAATAHWGPTCNRFVEGVGKHHSKGSHNYYRKTHQLYFDGIYRSLCEIDRVLRPGGDSVLVVQDSHYKDIHNDLPRIIEEMAEGLGWSRYARHDYDAMTLMSRVHPGSRKYRSNTRATESVLHFRTSRLPSEASARPSDGQASARAKAALPATITR